MENLILSFNVIAPLFFLMIIGYVLVHGTKLADKELCSKANALVFKVFLPCMLFKNIYQSDIKTQMKGELCLFAAGSLLVLFLLLCFIVPRVVKQENQQGVVIQGIFRSNYVIFWRCCCREYVWVGKYRNSRDFKRYFSTNVQPAGSHRAVCVWRKTGA